MSRKGATVLRLLRQLLSHYYCHNTTVNEVNWLRNRPRVAPVLLPAKIGAELTESDVYWPETELSGKNVKLAERRLFFARRYRYGFYSRSNCVILDRCFRKYLSLSEYHPAF